MNKLQIVGLLLLITLVCPAWVQAQGKLGRARESVRRSKSKPAAQLQKENTDEDDDRNKQRKKKRKTNKPSRRKPRSSSVPLLTSLFIPRIRPRPVVNQIHVHETVYVPAVEQAYVPVDSSIPRPEETVVAQPLNVSSESFDTSSASAVDPRIGDAYFSSPSDWFSRFTVQGGSDFDGLGQGGIGLLLQPANSLGIEASATLFRESGTEFRDHLWLGDVNLLFEPISGDVRLRFGVGLNWLGDTFGGEAGFNLTAGTDIQLTNRWVLTGEIDYGTLGDSDLLHTQVTLGAVFGNREVFAGYNYYDIGGAELDGVIFGLRFRF